MLVMQLPDTGRILHKYVDKKNLKKTIQKITGQGSKISHSIHLKHYVADSDNSFQPPALKPQ